MDASKNKFKTLSFAIIIIYLISLGAGLILSIESAQDEKEVTGPVVLEFFYSVNCPHCKDKEENVIDKIIDYYSSNENVSVIKLDYSITKNNKKFVEYGFISPPGVVVLNQTNSKFNIFFFEEITEENLKKCIEYHLAGNYSDEKPIFDQNKIINSPFGPIDLSTLSLPVLTVVLGAIDSVNPCSFFILLFLLNLLLYAKSRKRMFIIGSIFIFFSGFIYFLLMALLLTTFAVIEQPLIVTMIAGFVALVLGFVNIKDYFYFKQGFSLSISEDKKQKLFSRMRSVVRIKHLPTMIFATIILAIFANTYELACTLALPVVYTDFLTNIYNVPVVQSYFYLLFYNIVYVIPLILIVLVFIITLGRRKLSEFQGRLLKLLSGLMMFSFGLIMILNPNLLKNIFAAVGILLISFVIAVLLYYLEKKHT